MYKEGRDFRYSFESHIKSLSRLFFFFFLYFFSKIDVCVIKIVKLLGRAQATMDEAVCRAQSWLQRVRWISGCAIDRLYAGQGTDNGANEAESTLCRKYVHTEGLSRGGRWQAQGSLLRAKLGVFVSALILLGKQSRSHPLYPHHQYALLCLW